MRSAQGSREVESKTKETRQGHGQGAGTGTGVEEIRGKIRELRIKPAFLRCLGPYVTKEDLESIYQKTESLTRIFEEMQLFCVFSKKEETRDKPTAAGA